MYQKNRQGWKKHLDFMLLDLICLEISLFVAYILWQGNWHLYENEVYANMALILFLVDICVFLFMDTLKNVLKRGPFYELRMTLKHMCIVVLIAVLYLFTIKDAGQFSRMTLFLMAGIYLVLTYGARLLWKRYVNQRYEKGGEKSMLIITDDAQFASVQQDIAEHSYDKFQITGVVVLDTDRAGQSVEGIPIVANEDTVFDYICHEWVDEVFVDLQPASTHLNPLVRELSEMGVTIHIKLAERLNLGGQKQLYERLGKYAVLTTSINVVSGGQLFVKRLFDIVGGLVGSLIAAILFIFLAPAIYSQSPGPVIFSQTRIGKNGKKFKFYKFRSMYLDAEERKQELAEKNRVSDGMMFKLDYDPRIIGCKLRADGTVKKGLGNYIRDWSLDEFPQFWNVLKGDMSLVGTRPPTEDEWVKYTSHHRSRLAIKPGITGMWQVGGRSNITDFEEVVELDREYIVNWSLALDIKILLKTVPAVLGKDGSM